VATVNNGIGEIENDADVQEFQELLVSAATRIRKKARTAGISVLFFAASVGMVILISTKGPFHSYWPYCGKIAVYLSLVAMMATGMTVGFLWSEWSVSRMIRKDFNELLEDRYGVDQR
jgi:hypothetical protein